MELETLIGATLAVGFDGLTATPALIAQLRATRAQSVVVFSRNFSCPAQFCALLRGLEQGVGHRLLVMVDHEGGRIIRFSEGVTRFPDARTIGAAQTPDRVESQGAVEARELSRLGVGVNLAPCADVAVAGSDPVIGDRSYGPDPEAVAARVAARIRGLQAHGVAACAKHFPGLGAVPKDPHAVLPTIGLAAEAMERVHLPPFQAAFRSGVAMVMSSHVCYPGLGEPPGLPATFSPALIRGLLRRRLGFGGAILTDDLEMGALRHLGSIGEAAVRAAEAGHDLLLICSDLEAAREAGQALREAHRSGRLSLDELEGSASRMSQIREKYLPNPLPEEA
jgi:beta-N-acetylhexosaminidase